MVPVPFSHRLWGRFGGGGCDAAERHGLAADPSRPGGLVGGGFRVDNFSVLREGRPRPRALEIRRVIRKKSRTDFVRNLRPHPRARRTIMAAMMERLPRAHD